MHSRAKKKKETGKWRVHLLSSVFALQPYGYDLSSFLFSSNQADTAQDTHTVSRGWHKSYLFPLYSLKPHLSFHLHGLHGLAHFDAHPGCCLICRFYFRIQCRIYTIFGWIKWIKSGTNSITKQFASILYADDFSVYVTLKSNMAFFILCDLGCCSLLLYRHFNKSAH